MTEAVPDARAGQCQTLRLGCGRDTVGAQWNVDAVALPGVDEVVDLDDTPWPWPDNSWQMIIAEHVFEHLEDMEAALRECERILKPGARLRVIVPMGVNADADDDHSWGEGRPWTWQTPEFYCGERHWDVDTGLSVVSKRLRTHTHLEGPLAAVERMLWKYHKTRYGPGEWCFGWPCISGEFIVVFQNSRP